MKRKIVFQAICGLFLSLFANGQYAPEQIPRVTSVVAPSADISALSRMNEIPVNYYTGIPQVGYPVYQYDHNGLKLSVSLSYFAGGVKVEEAATNVGLGWTLDAGGGAIVRNIRGIPDDYPGKGFIYTAAIPASPGPLLDSIYNDKTDSQLDIFQFSCGGRTGKFYLGKNKNVLVVPDAKVKVEYTTGTMGDAEASTIQAFSITTEDGTRYVYSDREISRIASYGEGAVYLNKTYVSAWYLSKIVAPFQTDSILFTYENFSASYTSRTPEVTITDPTRSNFVIQNNSKFIDVSLQGKKIKRVALPDNTSVNFIYDTRYRCDTYGESALRRIEVSGAGLRKGVKLDYMYSTPGGYVSYNQPCNGPSKEYRLMLRQITNYTDKAESPPTIYEYEKDVMLPARDSKSIDFWGFYNGKDNVTLVPPYGSITTGGNRSADFHYMRAGSLRRIIQPTGGYVQLDYEGNENFTSTTQDKMISFSPYFSADNFYPVTFSKLFSAQVLGSFKFTNSGSSTYFQSGHGNGATIRLKVLDDSKANVLSSQVISPQQLANIGSIPLNISLPYNGNYYMQCTFVGFASEDMDYLSCAMTWKNDQVLEDHKQVGGLRIKRQMVYDGVAADKVTTSEYRYVNEAGQSSGYTTSTPVYYYRTGVTANNTFYPADVRLSEPLNGLVYTQGSPSGYARVEVINGTAEKNTGKTIYEFTSLKDLMQEGAVPWFYSDYTAQEEFPYPPKEKADWSLGLPVAISEYGADGRMVSRTTNFYSSGGTPYVSSDFKSLKVGVNREIQNGDSRTNVYVNKEFYPLKGTAQLLGTTRTTYFDDGSSIVQVSSFEYDPVWYTLRKSSTDYDRSRGLSLEKRYYYPYDYTIGDGIGSLRTAGIITPVATETWLTGPGQNRLFSMDAIEYKLNGTVARPFKTYGFVAKQPLNYAEVPAFNPALLNRIPAYLKEMTSVDLYDAKGNAVQVRDLQTGVISSVVMDDDLQVEIAKASNATASEIAYTSFESGGKGGWTYAGAAIARTDAVTGNRDYLLSAGNITKAALPAGKDYYLSFWAKAGTASVSGGTVDLSQTNSSTGWTFYRYKVAGGNSITISGNARIDELRLHPVVASMNTTAFDASTALQTAVTDANNRVTYYEYDSLNRLRTVRDPNRNIVRYNQYIDIKPGFENNPQSKTFNRYCENGEGSAVTYTVPRGKYVSYISQTDADEKALADIEQNGQQYANATGSCTYYNDALSVSIAKQGCPPGSTGSEVVYTVPARKYASSVSKAAANAAASQEVSQNGQTYANANGICTPNLLYLKFSLQNRQTNNTVTKMERTSTTTVDLVAQFYTDAACTIPFSVKNYSLSIDTRTYTENYMDEVLTSNTYNSTATYTCNGSTVTLTTGAIERQRVDYRKYDSRGNELISTDYYSSEATYTVKPDSRYIIK